ncbi:MAG: hypothetical protein PHI06_02435 [Desulfobulbaceae bacterium]|nr:hypothetical protein [Desulfobulbaceae bacterium]
MPAPSPVNCLACRHFYITYEPNHPYGCRALNFKAKEMPSRVVYASSGMECQSFSPKKGAAAQ